MRDAITADGRIGPARVLLSGFLWFAGAVAATFVSGFVLSIVIGIDAGIARKPLAPGWTLPWRPIFTLLGGYVLQLTLLAAALHLCRRQGQGSRRIGLGWNQVGHRWVVVGLTVVLLLYQLAMLTAALRFPTLRHFDALAARPLSVLYPKPGSGHFALIAARDLLSVGVAPLAEETFFRGWLWTGLRRSWSAPLTGVVTGVLWLALHMLDGLYRPIFLIPTAILLTTIRILCRSVRASLAAHIANNGLAMGLLTVAEVWGRG